MADPVMKLGVGTIADGGTMAASSGGTHFHDMATPDGSDVVHHMT